MPALRPVDFQQLIRVFEQDGFRYVRRPFRCSFKNLLRTSGMTRERYFQLLKES